MTIMTQKLCKWLLTQKKAGAKNSKKGDLVWRARCPYPGEGYGHFYVPFGSIKVDY